MSQQATGKIFKKNYFKIYFSFNLVCITSSCSKYILTEFSFYLADNHAGPQAYIYINRSVVCNDSRKTNRQPKLVSLDVSFARS